MKAFSINDIDKLKNQNGRGQVNVMKYQCFKNRVITLAMTLLVALVMVTPVMANSSGWYFLAFYDGRVVNGHDNGVFHQMNAGYLTVAGTLETTAIYGSPNGNQGWTFEVWKDTFIHQKMCGVGKVAAPASWGDTVSFSYRCANVASGSYFMKIWRAETDNREVEGWGTLSTP